MVGKGMPSLRLAPEKLPVSTVATNNCMASRRSISTFSSSERITTENIGLFGRKKRPNRPLPLKQPMDNSHGQALRRDQEPHRRSPSNGRQRDAPENSRTGGGKRDAPREAGLAWSVDVLRAYREDAEIGERRGGVWQDPPFEVLFHARLSTQRDRQHTWTHQSAERSRLGRASGIEALSGAPRAASGYIRETRNPLRLPVSGDQRSRQREIRQLRLQRGRQRQAHLGSEELGRRHGRDGDRSCAVAGGPQGRGRFMDVYGVVGARSSSV